MCSAFTDHYTWPTEPVTPPPNPKVGAKNDKKGKKEGLKASKNSKSTKSSVKDTVKPVPTFLDDDYGGIIQYHLVAVNKDMR